MDYTMIPASRYADIYGELVKEYIEELHQYDETQVFDETLNWQASVPCTNLIVCDSHVVGFIFFGVNTDKSLPRHSFGIAEFYIRVAYRRKGLGFAVVRDLSEYWFGNIYLEILDKNFPATAFWDHVEQELHWERLADMSAYPHNEGCELRVYHPPVSGRLQF